MAESTPPAREPAKVDTGAKIEKLLAAKQVAEANRVVDDCATGEPDSNWEFWRMAARTKLQMGDAQSALIFAERTLAVQPRDSETKVVLGTALARTGQPEKGEKILSEMASRFSRELSFQTQLAEARLLAGKLPEAERTARAAVKLCPDDVEQAPAIGRAYTMLGATLNAQKRYQEAIPILRQSDEFYPNFAETWMQLAVALVQGGKVDEGLVAAERAARLSPNDARMLAGVGHLLVAQKKWSAASAMLERAVQLDPKFKPAWLDLAVTAKQLNNPDRVRAAENAASALP